MTSNPDRCPERPDSSPDRPENPPKEEKRGSPALELKPVTLKQRMFYEDFCVGIGPTFLSLFMLEVPTVIVTGDDDGPVIMVDLQGKLKWLYVFTDRRSLKEAQDEDDFIAEVTVEHTIDVFDAVYALGFNEQLDGVQIQGWDADANKATLCIVPFSAKAKVFLKEMRKEVRKKGKNKKKKLSKTTPP